MIVGTVNRCAKHARFGRIAIDETLSHPLLEQRPDHLAIEPAVEPGDEAAHLGAVDRRAGYHRRAVDRLLEIFRSEEHTSELQSLMRISYAVFCLKKKKTKYQLSKADERLTTPSSS